MSTPPRPLRVVVADDGAPDREWLRRLLTGLGHQVVAEVANGRELVESCRSCRPDLVIADVRMPGLDGIAAAEEIYQGPAAPVILVSAYHDDEQLARAAAGHAMAYLVKPVQGADLAAAVPLALARFGQFQAARREADGLRQALEDRKVIERAKGIVMRRLGVDEGEAFRRLRKLATDHNRKLVDVARAVLEAEEVFRPLDQS